MAAGVPWRRVWVVLAAVAVAVAGVVVVVRADGFAAVDATVPRATRWFMHEDTGRAVLVDGFSGTSLARIEASEDGDVLQLVQSASGVALIDRSNATIRTVDAAQMRLGPEQSVDIVSEPRTFAGFGQPGAVAVDPVTSDAVVVPPNGEAVPFTVDAAVGADTHVSPDGAIWSLAGDELIRATTNGTEVRDSGLGDAKLTLAGNEPLVFDLERSRVRYGSGQWVALPSDVDASEYVLQEPGPAAECGWIGANDDLRCIGDAGVVDAVTIDGLDIDGSDLLAIAGDAGVVVRPGLGRIDRLDWRAARLLGADDDIPFPRAGAELALAASVDLVWVDDVSGEYVWAIHPWGMDAVRKNDESTPLLGASGDTIDAGEPDDTDAGGGLGADELAETLEREPDDDGEDDPPVAMPDQVTSRFGVGVPIVVTANDYDPDGEAIAISAVTNGRRGEVSITDATTVLYSPEPNLVGTDQFEYTIVDGNGTEASTTVTVELLPVDAPNQAPVGALDRAQTSQGNPVVIDVLLNDIDPERDQLRVSEFDQPGRGGTVVDTEGPTGLPALEYRPPPDLVGPVRFEYTPMDSFGATGKPVQVLVDIASGDENRSPLARPDSLRVRRDVSTLLPVMANDVDPDGDPFTLAVVEPLPKGLDVDVVESQLRIRVLPGSADLLAFRYEIDDQVSEPAIGRVLVFVIPESEPNRPPVANADNETAVVGEPVVMSVLANDKDPDDDPIRLVSVSQPDTGAIGTVTIRGDQVEYLAGRVDAEEAVFDRFTYTITDGRGNTGIGEVTVRVLPEALPSPPFARDDNASTEVDRAVTIDVLRNDGDPSGETPVIVGPPGCPAGGAATITSAGEVRYVPPSGRSGVFSCQYQIRNSQGLTATASILIDVAEAAVVNRAPIVPDVSATVTVGTTQVIDLLQNASDPDDDPIRVLSVSPPTIGRIESDGNIVRFTAPSQPGEVSSFSFMVGDARGATTPGRVSVRIVDEAPVAPEATNDLETTEMGKQVTVDVLRNDLDPDGDRDDLVITSADVTSGSGSVSIDGRLLTVTPAQGFEGEMTVTYQITDPDNLVDSAELRVLVARPTNQPPLARDDFGDVVNGGTVVVQIAVNDTDPDGGDVLTYRLVSGASSDLGQATLDGTSLVFQAAPGAFGTATIGYSLSDGTATSTAVVRIAVAACSVAAPEAPDRFFATGYLTPIQIDLTTDARNGDIVDVGPPLNAANTVYTPPAGFNDNVTLTYTVRNACRVQDTGTVTIDVNQDPVAGSVNEVLGRSETRSIPVSALASDDEVLTIVELQNAPEWVTIADGGATLAVAPAGRAGRADLVAVVADPGGLRAQVPVSITLTNLAPVATADSFQGGNGALVLDLLANDFDPDPLDKVNLQSVPETVTFANGVTVAVEVLGNNQIRINPGAGSGVAQFTYTIVDTQGLPSQPATVTVTVNSPPIAPPVDITVVADQTPQQSPVPATDPDGQQLTLELIDAVPPQLTITIDGLNLTITAAPEARNNTFALGYRVTDPLGASAQGVLNIRVDPPVPPPPTTAPVEVTMDANTDVTVEFPVSDPAGGPPPTITIPDNPTPLAFVADGINVTIDAPRRAGGNTYDLVYRATTAGGGVATNTLRVIVVPD